MASGIQPTSSNHFEAKYEAPWGGVASDKAATDIAPSQLVTMDGVSIRNGVLCYSTISAQSSKFNFILEPPISLISPFGGTGGFNFGGAYICLIFNCGPYLCAVDQYGMSYIATDQGSFAGVRFLPDQVAANGPSYTFEVPTTVKVVDGVAYISVYNTNTLYKYTPTVSYAIATQYTAGQYIDIFEEYMLQLNTNSSADGIQPSRINWSSPDQFSVWDASVDRTAGFQSLTSSEDYISGFIAVDNVGYIFRKEGVTQIAATGIAIQPFNFTTYWNSVAGQGLVFPATLTQYGRQIYLVTDSNAYEFYSGAFTPIGDVAKAAIFASFNQVPSTNAFPTNLVAGGFSIYPFNDKVPSAEYIFMAATAASNGNIVFWLYNIGAKTWTSITRNINALAAEAYSGSFVNASINWINTASIFVNYKSGSSVSISNLSVNVVYINFSFTDSLGGISVGTYSFFNLVNTPTSDQTSFPIPTGALNLVFRQEEIKQGRVVTIRRVVVKACGLGTLNLTVNDKTGTPIVLDGTQKYKNYKSSLMYTGECPQLSITSSNFNGRIVKVMPVGTYAEGDID